MSQKNSGSEKVYGKEGGGSIKISFENFFDSQCQKISYVNPYCVINFGTSKTFTLQSVMSRLSSKVFCLTVPKHFFEEPSYAVFQKIRVAKKFMDKREGEVSRFPAKVFCLTVPKKAVGE